MVFSRATPDTSTQQNPPSVSYYISGYHPVTLVVKNNSGSDSITKANYVHVYSPPQTYITGPTDLCPYSQATITAHGGTQYHRSTGDTTSSINITAIVSTTYTIRIANGPCFIDTSFTIHVDTCFGISSIATQFEVSIYPNPTSSFLLGTIEKPIAKLTYLSILDITARTLISKKTNLSQSQLNIDVSSLSPGIYFIKLQTDEGILVKKFVKE